MLRARREARQGGAPPGKDPRYAQIGGRTRYRERNQGYPTEQYNLQQDQSGYFEHQQFQQSQFPQHQSLQQQFDPIYRYGQQNGHQFGSAHPPWQQEALNSGRVVDFPPQYGVQQPIPPPFNWSGPLDQETVQKGQAYSETQLPELPVQQVTGYRPCVIPQISHKRFSGENMSPFVRVRVPELEHLISSHELIVFIDELNEAFMANPALQTANNAANIAGMAPSVIAQLVGVGVNVAAGVGSAVTSKVRAKNYLAKTNEELFHPKGLHAQICKTDKMLEYVGLGGQQNVFVRQQYQSAFESAQQVPVSGPIDSSQVNSHPVMQRMCSLGNRVMKLSFSNVEAAATPEGFWKKWGAKEASKAEQKQNEKILKDRAKEQRRSGRRVGGRGSSRRQDRQDEKKEKETKKILWIVITTKEESAGGDDEWDSGSEH